MTAVESSEPVRIDKWLWAARFFKTRSLASQAVAGGKVHCNGNRIKPSRVIQLGDKLQITIGDLDFNITVVGINEYRRPASEARLLYSEPEESIQARTEAREMRKLMNGGFTAPATKPGKRDRRKIRSFTRKD